MHYLENLTNRAIGERLGISRFRVARLIEQALNSGIVTISIAAPHQVDVGLSNMLRRRYGLAEALVLPTEEIQDDGTVRAAVASLAAQFVSQLASEGSRIGIAWGKTLADFAVATADYVFAQADAVQLLGNLPSVEGSMHAGDVLLRLGDTLKGNIYPLHAPLILPTRATADGIKSDESIRRTMQMYEKLDLAIVGIGSWAPPSSRLLEVLPVDDVRAMQLLTPVADVCANLFDVDGGELTGDHSGRTLSITPTQLKAVPMTIAIASGEVKADAIRAVIRSGILNVVVTDGKTAEALLG